ncbi:chemotaxis protein CheB [Alloyangia mangrovi]|uniref:chemotaxis protein CheB n=1 Tax=Alloyangia mangrovi TaxID=1779329 RepID=UPI0021A58795|nr:chemotaxis protein CheB [Alloyangia mangrovi]
MKDKDAQQAPAQTGDSERLCIVGIGASAGGLEAIREMLTAARATSNLAYVVIQHLDPNHESLLAELLARHTELRVRQASGGEKITAGNVYIIPPRPRALGHKGGCCTSPSSRSRGGCGGRSTISSRASRSTRAALPPA